MNLEKLSQGLSFIELPHSYRFGSQENWKKHLSPHSSPKRRFFEGFSHNQKKYIMVKK